MILLGTPHVSNPKSFKFETKNRNTANSQLRRHCGMVGIEPTLRPLLRHAYLSVDAQ